MSLDEFLEQQIKENYFILNYKKIDQDELGFLLYRDKEILTI